MLENGERHRIACLARRRSASVHTKQIRLTPDKSLGLQSESLDRTIAVADCEKDMYSSPAGFSVDRPAAPLMDQSFPARTRYPFSFSFNRCIPLSTFRFIEAILHLLSRPFIASECAFRRVAHVGNQLSSKCEIKKNALCFSIIYLLIPATNGHLLRMEFSSRVSFYETSKRF